MKKFTIVPTSKTDHIITQTAGKETLIYDNKREKAFLLNETSSFVWRMCDGKYDVSEISSAFAKANNQPDNEEIVLLALEQLKENDLLSNSAKLPIFVNKANRREVIKKIGFASAIALPLITNLVAPKSVSAASCLGNGQTDCNIIPCCPGLTCSTGLAATGTCIPAP